MAQLTGSVLTYPLFYLAALAVSILPSYLKNQKNPNYLSLGASGAVSAVLFAFIPAAMDDHPGAVHSGTGDHLCGVLRRLQPVDGPLWRRSINHSAHLAGAAFGVMFMLIMEPRVWQVFLEQLSNPRFG